MDIFVYFLCLFLIGKRNIYFDKKETEKVHKNK